MTPCINLYFINVYNNGTGPDNRWLGQEDNSYFKRTVKDDKSPHSLSLQCLLSDRANSLARWTVAPRLYLRAPGHHIFTCCYRSVRYIIFDKYANVVALHQLEFPQYYPNPGYVVSCLRMRRGVDHMGVDPDGTSTMLMKFNNMRTSALKKVQSRWKPLAGQRKVSRLLVRATLSHEMRLFLTCF